MRVFERLRALRAFENQHFLFLRTGGNHHLIGEIGHHQAIGKPLTLKQLFLLDIGSVATVQRHLRQLKELGFVQHRRAARDGRAVEVMLTPKCIRLFAKYDSLMTVKSPVGKAEFQGGEATRLFGLCDSASASQRLIVPFLARGLKLGSKCLLVAPAAAQMAILKELNDRRKGPRQIMVSEGYDSGDAHVAFLKRILKEAKRSGHSLRIAADMSWIMSKNVPVDAMLDNLGRFDVMTQPPSLMSLRVFDVRYFSSKDILRTMKCFRDRTSHSIVVG